MGMLFSGGFDGARRAGRGHRRRHRRHRRRHRRHVRRVRLLTRSRPRPVAPRPMIRTNRRAGLAGRAVALLALVRRLAACPRRAGADRAALPPTASTGTTSSAAPDRCPTGSASWSVTAAPSPLAGRLQRLLRQRLPDPARREAVLARPLAAGPQARRRAGRRRGLGRVAARHPHAREAARAGPDRRPLDRPVRRRRLRRGRVRQPRLVHAQPRPARRRPTPGVRRAAGRRRAHDAGLAAAAEEPGAVGRHGRRLRLRDRRAVRPVRRVRRLRRHLRRPRARRSSTGRRAFRAGVPRLGRPARRCCVATSPSRPDGTRRWCSS